MSERLEKSVSRMYRDLARILTPLLKVPTEPPSLPVAAGETIEQFHPAPGFLSYLKLWFWIVLILVDVLIAVAWIVICVVNLLVGVLLLPLVIIVGVVPDLIAFVAIHLRYDFTWYAITQRSLRIRRGIWIIHETTITFENVQNVRITQGPVQRYYGISNVIVETAGSGGEAGKRGTGVSNLGIIEGIADAARIRDLILSRVRRSTTAGLGDEEEPARRGPARRTTPAWSKAHVALLREIRDEVALLD